jgi:hypothetical protein
MELSPSADDKGPDRRPCLPIRIEAFTSFTTIRFRQEKGAAFGRPYLVII